MDKPRILIIENSIAVTGDWNYDTEILKAWDGRSQQIGDLRDGKELLIIAKPNIILN